MLERSNSPNGLTLDVLEHVLDEHSLVAITDAMGNITYANDMFCNVSKYPREELIGQNHRILKSGYHDSAFYKDMWKTILSGKIWKGEIKNKAKDGSFYWVKTTIMPIFDNQKKISHYIAIRTNITEIKEIQEKLLSAQRLSVIGELSARLTHDIRNPLGVIKNANELLRIILKNKLDERSKKLFDHSDNAIQRISHQINDVLNFVRINPPEYQTCDINEMVHNAINELDIPNNINVNVSDKSLKIQCDPFQMDIVFRNLLQNSIQAMEKGRVDINYKELQDSVIIEFVDSGQGMHEDIIEKVFEPLFTTKQKGTGLGLASVKRIVEAHEGKISVKNNPTTFTIQLPKTQTKT